MNDKFIKWSHGLAGLAMCLLVACEKPKNDTNTTAAVLREVADEMFEEMKTNDEWIRQQLGLPVTQLGKNNLEEMQQQAKLASGWAEKLKQISEEQLDHEEWLLKVVLEHELWIRIKSPEYYHLRFDITPYTGGWILGGPITILSSLPLESSDDRKNYLNVVDDFALIVSDVYKKTTAQAEKGIFLAKPAIDGAKTMLEGTRQSVRAIIDDTRKRLPELEPTERDSFVVSLNSRVDQVVVHFQSIIDLLDENYVSRSPDEVGLSHYPNGKDYYLYLIKQYTGLELDPEVIHRRGAEDLTAAAELRAEIREQLNFTGTAEEFKTRLMEDDRFYAESPEEVEERLMSFVGRMETLLPDYFAVLPKAPYGVRRLKPAQEPGMTYGYYSVPTPQDNTGYYNYNGSKLDQRNLLWAQHLIYHELVPGHHFHLATQLESEPVHPIKKFLTNGAFTEGWGEYGASLGEEMGLYSDPYDNYGHLFTKSFFANRLLIDTGMNFFGWSLDKGREEMLKNTFESQEQVNTETLRYSTDRPAQALNYSLGYLKIWDLRNKAEEALGEKFDIKDFHAQVVGQGSMPLHVLEMHIEWWIEQQNKG